jgi:hypothetical protein
MGHLYHFTPAVSSKKLWDTVSFSKGAGGFWNQIFRKADKQSAQAQQYGKIRMPYQL